MIKYDLEMILSLTKSLATLYLNGNVEAKNKNVLDLMMKNLKSTLELKEELYQKMSDDGFYTVNNIKSSDIEKVYKKLKG